MEALILSCSTGGGHNTAAKAITEELQRRGHHAIMMDPYELINKKAAARVGNTYIKLVQKAPRLFGFIYLLGDLYRRLPVHSPVYWINGRMSGRLQTYLQAHSYDVIVMTHVFPAEILTHMRHEGIPLPRTVFVATDYTCIPFTEESECDYYVIPSPELVNEYTQRGIPSDKLLPYGIPVRKEFESTITQEDAKRQLGLDPKRQYLLLSGGSIGAGSIRIAIRILEAHLRTHPNKTLIVLCGNHKRLYEILQRRYQRNPQVHLLKSTPKMALYMRACDLFISKPGGLSSTESAVSGIPTIHISPIPGCETRNVRFFASRGLSLDAGHLARELLPAVRYLQDQKHVRHMYARQKQCIPPEASRRICDFLENGK